jgi:hypothetical protein
MITVDDAIKSAKTLGIWCEEHKQTCECCPFDDKQDNMCAFRIPPSDVLVDEYIKGWEARK